MRGGNKKFLAYLFSRLRPTCGVMWRNQMPLN